MLIGQTVASWTARYQRWGLDKSRTELPSEWLEVQSNIHVKTPKKILKVLNNYTYHDTLKLHSVL